MYIYFSCLCQQFQNIQYRVWACSTIFSFASINIKDTGIHVINVSVKIEEIFHFNTYNTIRNSHLFLSTTKIELITPLPQHTNH